MFKQLLVSTALATALTLTPALAQDNGEDEPGATEFAPGQLKGDEESARALAPGQRAQETLDPDDTPRDYAPGQQMQEEEEEEDDLNNNNDLND